MANQKLDLIYSKVINRTKSATAGQDTKKSKSGQVSSRDHQTGKVGSKYEDFIIKKAQIFKEKLSEKAKELEIKQT